jgi:hypothetical protein
VTSEVRPLLECFANGHSMDVIFVVADMLIEDANNDGELGEWFRSFNSQGALFVYFVCCLQWINLLFQVLLQVGYVHS